MKKLMSVLLALVLVLAMVPVAASAVDVNSAEAYNALKSAIEAAPADGSETTVTLTGDISGMSTDEIITIAEGQNIRFDMNGYSITVDNGFEGRPFINYGTFVVTGNGKIDSSNSEFGGLGAINNFGMLTIENGTFAGNISANGAGVYNRAGGTLTINGGDFTGTAAVNSEGSLTINDGNFHTVSCNQYYDSNHTSTHWAYCVISSGELYFYNGTVTGVQGALAINSGYAEVYDGTFTTTPCNHGESGEYSFYALYIAGEEGEVEAHIYGGNYTAAYRVALLCGNDNTGGDGGINARATANIHGGTFVGGPDAQSAMSAGANTGDPAITGGTFTYKDGDGVSHVSDVTQYISDGAALTQNEEGQIITDDSETIVASIDEVGYTSLQAAIKAAGDGDTVEVYAGTHDGSIVIDGKDITLEGPVDGEAVITIGADTASQIVTQIGIAGETTPYSGIVAVKDATVTLKNLTIQGNAEAASAVNALTHTDRYAGLVVLDADVTVENCAITDITYTNGPDGLQGMQNGFGIYAVAASKHNLTLTNVDITNFNKAAAVIRSNVDLTMTGGSVTGYGAQAVISQNGIQYAGNATISGTTFSGLQYTAENEWKGGSTAIYNVGTGTESTIENVKTEEVDYAVSASASTNITGGIYAGKIYGEPVAEGEDSVLSVSGGTYPDCDVTEYLEEGLEQNENGTVVKDTPSTPGGTPSEPEEPTWPFTDVTEGDDWFYDAVAYVYENNIMAGTDETTFAPYMELDRAQAAQLFYNLDGKPAVTGDSAFTDVTSGHWAVDAITWAAQNDIVAGIGGGLYDPDSNVTREQFAVMLYKYARFKGYDLTAAGDLTQFPDAGSISSWAETALSWANGKGLINGHENGTIDPKGSTIRAQAASIMANFDQNVAN